MIRIAVNKYSLINLFILINTDKTGANERLSDKNKSDKFSNNSILQRINESASSRIRQPLIFGKR